MTGTTAERSETQPALLLSLVERALNGYLALDASARRRLLAMEGETLIVEVRGLGRRYALQAREGRCLLLESATVAGNATMRGAPLSLLKMAATDGTRTLFSGDVELLGDVEVGKRFKRLFDALDIDWEEHLSMLVGDYPARRLWRTLQLLAAWRRRSATVLARDIGDYLNEEQAFLSPPNQLTDLHDAVDELRDDVARLSARLARYEHRQLDT